MHCTDLEDKLVDNNNALAARTSQLRDDLTSGAAEIALRAIGVFQTALAGLEEGDADAARAKAVKCARAIIDAQPGMAPLFHLANSVLLAMDGAETGRQAVDRCQQSLDSFERRLCESASLIADQVFDLIPAGELVFAFSFSSTVVSSLLNARAAGKLFRVACTEARPSMEGRKLASRLAAGGIEVLHTFDPAFGLILPRCRAAFMGCDAVGRPGLVNKVGSWSLAVSCRELGIPLYALSGTEKIVGDERFFEFERHERPADEVWPETPPGVRVLNHQFEIVPYALIAGLVTERGMLKEKDVGEAIAQMRVHPKLVLEESLSA